MATTPAPPAVVDRVERFESNLATYRSPAYNEASLRVDFLDTLFGLGGLGWDVHNDGGASERYKDVVVEEPIAVGSRLRRTDYIFRIGESSKFVVEAKKPSVNILSDSDAAYQLRSYGWNKHLNLCILTNFENFVVYDVRKPPKPSDPPHVGRVASPYSYKDYLTRWGEIASVFSKESVIQGRFDAAADKSGQQGSEPVDRYFLGQIEAWRHELATHLKARNQDLTQPELNYSVQSILDRIVFLRICEDREVEPRGRLKACASGPGIYVRLLDLFRLADQRYNSGLFHFEAERGRPSEPDLLTPRLSVGDEPIRRILRDLYESPYDFREIPLEVLGQVYEQFLGKVIVVTEKRARVEEKPEVRKAGGVFYTPQYVVDYLVESTVGRLLEGMTPEQAAQIRILDPACGSGSFLLRAYQSLLDWHLEQYTSNPKKWRDRLAPSETGRPVLASKERARILLTNLFGVDVDSQAVEVTKLSLLLKALEKIPGESIDRQLKLFHERALPDLGANIKRGNSLVGADFYATRQTTLIEPNQTWEPDVFRWEGEFPTVFSRPDPGFDAVIGNPPYIPIEMMHEPEKRYFEKVYPELTRKYDSSVVFILSMLKKLRSSGRLGFISSVTWQTGENFSGVRETMLLKHGLERLINLPYDVFKDAYVDTCLYTISAKPSAEYGLYSFPKREKHPDLSAVKLDHVPTELLAPPEFKIIVQPRASALLTRLNSLPDMSPLGELTKSTQGLAAGRFNRTERTSDPQAYPFLERGQVYRYFFEVVGTYLVDMSDHASLAPHYEAQPKILIRRVVSRDDRLLCAYYDGKMVFKKDVNPFTITDARIDPMYLLGLLNSRMFSYLYLNTSSIATKDDFRQTTLAELRRLPIRLAGKRGAAGEQIMARIASSAKEIQELSHKLSIARTETERTLLTRNLGALDQEVDRLTYRLYGLSDGEVRDIESATRPAAWRTS